MTRPAVPAELRRRILVEAGHRCAIHTCKNPDVDVHHIIPWEKVKEHSYENLIALCPNCHRRADRGDIDAKSLRLYKAGLQASIMDSGPQSRNTTTQSPRGRWTKLALEETFPEPSPYEVSVEFPRFLSDHVDLDDLNLLLEAEALSHIARWRRKRVHSRRLPPPSFGPIGDSYWQSFEVALQTDTFVSIKFSWGEFREGAAHPMSGTTTRNFLLSPLISLEIEDFILSEEDLLSVSLYVQQQLAYQKNLTSPNEWIQEGAKAEFGNYRRVNVLSNGLSFTFDPYAVGPYSDGPAQVYVPSFEAAPYVNPNTELLRIWGAA